MTIKSILAQLDLVEGDAKPPVHEDSPPPRPSAAAPVFPPSSTYSTPSNVAPQAAPFYTGPVVMTPEDQASLTRLEQRVYATPSSYIIFRDLRAAMGNPPDPHTVFAMLKVANPGVTPEKVAVDVDTHLAIIDTTRYDFEGMIAKVHTDQVEGPTQRINDLAAQNQAAAAQIEGRNQEIAQLKAGVEAASTKLSNGTAHFKLVADALAAPLLSIKQLLASAS